MSEWFTNQKKPTTDFSKLLQERFNKGNPRRQLTTDETKRQDKLEAIADKLKSGENVQNCQLQMWLSDDEYAQIEAKLYKILKERELSLVNPRGCFCQYICTGYPPVAHQSRGLTSYKYMVKQT